MLSGKKGGKDYHGFHKCLQEVLDCTTRTDTGAAITQGFAISVFFFFLSEWKQFPEEETWKNNFCSFKKKKNPDKDRDSECRREKYQRKWAAHSNGKEETTLLFCCWRCRTGNGSENTLETTS